MQNKENDITFGNWLRNKRNENGEKMAYIAKKINISHGHLYSLENGRRNPSNKNNVLDRIAAYFKLTEYEKRRMLQLVNSAMNDI